MRNLLAAIACLLAGCAGSTPSVESVTPPASLLVQCARPVLLPERALSDQEVEIWWGRDRAALRSCGSRHGALSDMMGRD